MNPLIPLVVAGVVVQTPSPDHDAWDIACQRGTPVYAVFDGTTQTSYNGRMGNQVTLEGGRTAYYAHLRSVEPGGPVKKGDVIGTCGNTGSWSSGPHVHFELR